MRKRGKDLDVIHWCKLFYCDRNKGSRVIMDLIKRSRKTPIAYDVMNLETSRDQIELCGIRGVPTLICDKQGDMQFYEGRDAISAFNAIISGKMEDDGDDGGGYGLEYNAGGSVNDYFTEPKPRTRNRRKLQDDYLNDYVSNYRDEIGAEEDDDVFGGDMETDRNIGNNTHGISRKQRTRNRRQEESSDDYDDDDDEECPRVVQKKSLVKKDTKKKLPKRVAKKESGGSKRSKKGKNFIKNLEQLNASV